MVWCGVVWRGVVWCGVERSLSAPQLDSLSLEFSDLVTTVKGTDMRYVAHLTHSCLSETRVQCIMQVCMCVQMYVCSVCLLGCMNILSCVYEHTVCMYCLCVCMTPLFVCKLCSSIRV